MGQGDPEQNSEAVRTEKAFTNEQKVLEEKVIEERAIGDQREQARYSHLDSVCADADSAKNTVCVLADKRDSGEGPFIRLSGTNTSYYDIDIRIALSEVKNLRPSSTNPQAILPPQTISPILLASLNRQDRTKVPNFSYNFEFYYGNPNVEPDGTLYVLPFPKGEGYRCTQGFNGQGISEGRQTHREKRRHSVDFSMPIGSVVTASREGVVAERRTDSTVVGSQDPKDETEGNYVRIRHDDGTYGIYWHLDRTSVHVGDKIQEGQEIGRSGNTGYSSSPHLHFEINRADSEIKRGKRGEPNTRDWRTVPWRFRKADGTAFVPQAGQKYTRE